MQVIFAFTLLACSSDRGNFSQYPGFDAIRAQLGDVPPNEEERALLQQHQPVLYVAADEEGPINFYDDYIGSGMLSDENGKITQNPSAESLNAVRHQRRAVFAHQPSAKEIAPSGYGGISRANLTLAGVAHELTFLEYHFVFRHSGLPAGVPAFYRMVADMVADSKDWHQLDHYTAAFVVLYQDKPFAVILQQHNYMRAYFIDEEAAFANGSVLLDVAIQSNELYPHRTERERRRAAGSMNKSTAAYLTGQQNGGILNALLTADDITEGKKQINYDLYFLPPNDALYVFEGWLGERRKLPGRDGPPGATYRNLPSLWALEKSLYAFYWHDNDKDYANIIADFGFSESALQKHRQRFAQKFNQLYGNKE